MLIVTGTAASAIRHLSARPGAGMRIAPLDDTASLLAVTPAERPASTDEVVEAEGARLFLDSAAAAFLHDKVLDVRLDDEGAVSFLITAPTR
ncbi:Fe-S cluster assembly protein HesB [Actinomadura sp. LD22]|uniref:Fe-S cluster assembly protein HesB n=1 Tax=Actinomadura physcomitrii TaxID=2650748 RepID=A0A6I4MKE6_9ACTN|nr:Fe-S cluster assembly protein HesB [Actinomadura physcomitrii]MWA04081.1 Fe-S cluster assembly protein HesB [Actinomadura physcomitrii]